MKKRFREALSARCKDMGLTDRAIDNLTEHGCKSLNDDSTDADIESAVNFVVPFAKEMQAEITRKTRKQPSQKQSNEEGENEGDNTQNQPQNKSENSIGNDLLSSIQNRLNRLEKENQKLREERSKAERKASLKAELKEQGMSEFFGDYISVPEGEDVKDYITRFKQGLISANLPDKGNALEKGGNSLEQRKQEAENWVRQNFKVD